MSSIFYSEVDKNLQAELTARAKAGKTDRSEAALRYMTERVANVKLTAFAQGSQRDPSKIVHELGGNSVRTGEYLPGGESGFLTDRKYILQEKSWTSPSGGVSIYDKTGFGAQAPKPELNVRGELKTNNSFRIPPHITSAEFQINDNTKGTTNKATINILIPNPDRDLDFMESIYARPGRYCLFEIQHPESAIMTSAQTGGLLTPDALPSRTILKQQFPEADKNYDDLRKMNAIQFEGVITSFEYAYQTDGTISMTVYLLGTSMTYTDLSLIMQTNNTGTATNSNANPEAQLIESASSLSQYYADVHKLIIDKKYDPPNDVNGFAAIQGTCLDKHYRQYLSVNAIITVLNEKILSKLQIDGNKPTIYSNHVFGIYSTDYDLITSANPKEVLIRHNSKIRSFQDPDCYQESESNDSDGPDGISWFPELSDISSGKSYLFTSDEIAELKRKLTEVYGRAPQQNDAEWQYRLLGRPGTILIELTCIQRIIADLNKKPDQFTVKSFLGEISKKIHAATGGGIDLKLTADPELPNVLYFRDTKWVGYTPENEYDVNPYEVPMFANHPVGTIVRDFKFSAKLPANAQSLMYTLNSSKTVNESDVAPYLNYMYNNAERLRSTNTSNPGVVYESTERNTYDAVQKQADEYAKLHNQYATELLAAKRQYGDNLDVEEKQIAFENALKKYMQYPTADLKQSTMLTLPTFPFEVEFTIDGINGFRYGDALTFPGLAKKYTTHTTFSIKGLTHNISTTGEWTTRVSCIMRPKF